MFETIYRKFISLFGSNLAEHLSGWDETIGDFSKSNIFSIVGIITLTIVLIACATYYYFLNHPRQNKWWKWLLIWLLPVAVLNFVIGFGITFADILSEKVSSDIADISWLNCLGFGFTNFIISALLFLFISFLIKWGSQNCKYSPFVKF